MSVYKGKKLALPSDLAKFLIKAMKRFRTGEVVITVHAVEPAPDNAWGPTIRS